MSPYWLLAIPGAIAAVLLWRVVAMLLIIRRVDKDNKDRD